MYNQKMLDLISLVENNREWRIKHEPERLTSEEKNALLKKYHPDYGDTGFDIIKVGLNAGEKAPVELVELLHANSRLLNTDLDLNNPKYDVDVLIIGGGGAGSSAAIEAKRAGKDVMIVTKLRLGDANSVMAEGGVQVADNPNDSPAQHYLDTMGGGHYAGVPELVKRLVSEGPEAISWLENLGVLFDKKPDGNMLTLPGGGFSRNRLHACRDFTGLEIMRVLKDEVICLEIPVVEYTAVLELIMDEKGNAAGAVLINMLTGEHTIARAKTVIIATGGAGRLHYHGFPTTNHYGATADGLILAYRAGAALLYQDTIQYHPTGVAYPSQLFGALVTEKVRSLGATLTNVHADSFIHHLETRDVVSSAIIKECRDKKGVETPTGFGVWLDTPQIEIRHGEGKILESIPGIYKMFKEYNIDIRKLPILMYPTFHYQNGGIAIETDGHVKNITNLFIAGEAIGGIHGRNRLLGNSMLDCIVFGRSAGIHAAAKSDEVSLGTPTLSHIKSYSQTLKSAGIETDRVSPKLLPDYVRKVTV